MTFSRLATVAAVLTLAAGGVHAQTAAPPAAPPASASPLVANGDLAQTLKLSPQFQIFAKAADATNLTGLLKSTPGMTIFAPTDAAFQALPPGELDRLMADKPRLQKLLTYHIINAKIDGAFIKGRAGALPSAANLPLDLQGGGEVLKVNDAAIVQADVKVSNGVIHVIDKVLTPGGVAEAGPAPVAAASPSGAVATASN
jgi:uncharacterized surface protein with fasciclin (FAS1) repeats